MTWTSCRSHSCIERSFYQPQPEDRTLLPRVLTIAARPCSVTPMNACGLDAERIASTATVTCTRVEAIHERLRAAVICNEAKCRSMHGNATETDAVSDWEQTTNEPHTLPSVPFLNPMGNDTPLASSRCSCDSVVRAPIAPHEIRSEMYCGEIVSSSSDPTGTPDSVRSHSSCRARRRPLLILNDPSMSGSLIKPFHPTVVRGF